MIEYAKFWLVKALVETGVGLVVVAVFLAIFWLVYFRRTP